MNIYPREVEEVMMKHPDISMVAVVGIADEKLGEEVKAFVVKKNGSDISEEEIKNWTKEKLASYKYPRSIEFLNQLPINASGKILKKLLKTEKI